MREERYFEPKAVSLSNLERNLEDCNRTIRLRRCELAFIADDVAKKAAVLMQSGLNLLETLTELSLEVEYLNGRSNSLDILSVNVDYRDKAAFAALICEKLSQNNIPISIEDFLRTSSAPETFVYVRNSLSDEAYDVFSQDFEDPRVTYADSFREAAFAVADGKVGHCILPYEEKGGVRIPGINSLVSALDLKITAITPVFGLGGTADVKYALFSSDFLIPERNPETDRYVEIKISDKDGVSLGELLSAAEFFDLSVYRLNTVEESRESSDNTYSIVFREGEWDLSVFLAYLTVFAGGFTPMGIYKNIE